MSSQNNNSLKSLKKLSDYILSEQSIDIKNYTVGHLNENHLHKLDPIKVSVKWDSNKGARAKKSQKKKSKAKPYSSMSDINEIMTNFREQDTVISERLQEGSFIKKDSDRGLYEGLVKLPDLGGNHDKKRSNEGEETIQDRSEEGFNACFPVTDKELAISFLNGPFKGASKAEKLASLTSFEKKIIQKKCLNATNNLHTIDSIDWLEKKLKAGLEKLENNTSDHKFQINIYRLDIFNNIFEQIIIESKLFGRLLNRIKEEYDEYLFYLLRNQQLLKLNNKNFQKKLDTARYLYTNNIDAIRAVSIDIEGTEGDIRALYKDRACLEKDFNSEMEFSAEKQNSLENSQLTMKSKSTKDKSYNGSEDSENQSQLESDRTQQQQQQLLQQKQKALSNKMPIAENIEATKFQILEKIKSLETVNEDLKKDYVPMQIITNLNQSIKDTDMEINKINDQNKYLTTKFGEGEENLKSLLVKNDKTEFADENTDVLLKMIRNFCVLISSSSEETAKDKKAKKMRVETLIKANDIMRSAATTTTANEPDQNENHYDDYFS